MMIMKTLVLLSLLASVSPLLTFAHLWQIKEWRIDRLREHMKTEGVMSQIFGKTRPALLAAFLVSGIAGFGGWQTGVLISFIAIGLLQAFLNKQPYPVWTIKAAVLCLTGLAITSVLTMLAYANMSDANLFFVAIPLVQPFILMAAWAIWKPIDLHFKKQIMKKAKEVRLKAENLTVIAITGSAGKSTTKELLSHIMKKIEHLSTPQHVNSEIGISRWIISSLPVNPNAKALIVEMGAYRKGEISLLCDIVRPQLGIVTFVGNQHIGLFGSQEALLSAKGELIEALPENGHAFLNGDNENCLKLKNKAKCKVTLAGTGGPMDMEANGIEETSDGIKFMIGDTGFFVPVHGTHNVTNILLAVSAAHHLGIQIDESAERLKTFQPDMHTFAMRKAGGIMILDDTHNSSPSSFSAAIAWAASQPYEYKTLLASGLIELGEAQDRIHRELGALSSGIFDRIIFLNKKSAKSFERGFGRGVEILTKMPPPVPNGSLLVCVGRLSENQISALFPKKPANVKT